MKLLYEMHFSINKTLAVSLYMEISLPISGEFLESNLKPIAHVEALIENAIIK